MDRVAAIARSPQTASEKDVAANAGAGWRDSPTLPHVETATAIAPPSLPGFEILQEIGRGGMGVVYKARDLANQQIVAVKVLLAGAHAGALERERFRREVSAAALQHPNVVKLLRAGEHAGLPYIVLEYVDGGTLADRLVGTPWVPAAAVRLVAELAAAVRFAHDRGIIHRDLKPANILFAGDTPKLTDFGLSKSLESSAFARPVTETGAVLGTPSYISPEQATGDKEVGPASDVYSLGAILYELLTGRPPFDGKTTLDIVLKVLNDAPIPPTRFSPELPNDLEAIVLKCLHKNPAKRYSSVAALVDDLHRHAAGETVEARPASVSRRLLTWFGRRPRLSGAAATAAVMVLVLLGAGAYAAASLRAAADRAAAAERAAEEARVELERERQNAERERYYAAELRMKYDQLRTFLESFRPGKIVWTPDPKKPTHTICVQACEPAPEPKAAPALPGRQLGVAAPILRLLTVGLLKQ
jgi:eukaryotic-like serine/threonine-protein kinase